MSLCPIGLCMERVEGTSQLYQHLEVTHGAKGRIVMDNISSADAFEQLEEARDEVATFEAGMWRAVSVLTIAAAVIVAGAVAPGLLPFLAGGGVAAIWVGSVVGVAAVLFIAFWVIVNLDGQTPYSRRAKAQRAYNRATRREGEKASGVTP